MAKNNESDLYGTTFSIESMKVIAETIGIANIPDDAAKELADDISFRIKHIIQDAAKFMNHSMRTKLVYSDIDATLRIKNIEPQYGFHSVDSLPFRFASGGGRELHFIEEKEVDLGEFVSNVNVKAPLEVTLRSHWLCIDGVQPTIPENPPPVSKDMQKLESVDPINKMNKPNKESSGKPSTGKQKLRNIETVQIKQLATHELSVEQQLYYKEITEACVGSDETRRTEALQSLASDPGLHEMLPRMCTFIIEGVRVNVVQNNLALLIYLMRMVKALLDNQSLFLEKYLHELIPSVTTCIVSKQLCMRPELDNHWALRDFASRLMAQICKNFNTSTNNIQTRVTRMFSNSLQQGDKLPLSSLYGALEGLSELGAEVIKTFILPRVKSIGVRIESHLEGSLMSNLDKIASGHIKALIVKVLAPILKNLRNPPDYFEEYKTEYGYLGPALQSAVMKARTQPLSAVVPLTTSIATVGTAISRTVSTPMGIVQRILLFQHTPIARFTLTMQYREHMTMLFRLLQAPRGYHTQNTSAPGRTILMNPSGRVTTPAGNQKIVFVTQRPQPQGTIHQTQPSVQTQPNTVVKIMSNTANIPNPQPKVVNAPQKLVVVCMPNSGPTSSTMINTQGQGQILQSTINQTTTNILSPNISHTSNQPSFSVLPKTNFMQQTQIIVKQENMQTPSIDDLSHLA